MPPWPGHRAYRDGLRVIGRGGADMKGGDAAILAVLEHAARTGLPVVGVFYDREEGLAHLNGLGAVLRGSRLLGTPSFAFVGEPTTCTVHAGCVGSINADITFHGRTGHAARPWEGENAIVRAAPFLARAAGVQSRAVVVDGLEFHDTLTITTAHGGTPATWCRTASCSA